MDFMMRLGQLEHMTTRYARLANHSRSIDYKPTQTDEGRGMKLLEAQAYRQLGNWRLATVYRFCYELAPRILLANISGEEFEQNGNLFKITLKLQKPLQIACYQRKKLLLKTTTEATSFERTSHLARLLRGDYLVKGQSCR